MGGLKSLQELSLGMGAGISLLLPPLRVLLLCAIQGVRGPGSSGAGDGEQSRFSAPILLCLELTGMKTPLRRAVAAAGSPRTSPRLGSVPRTAEGDTGTALCSHPMPLPAPPEPRWLWGDAVGRGAVFSLWSAQRGARGGNMGVGGRVDPHCRARLALGPRAAFLPGRGRISQRGVARGFLRPFAHHGRCVGKWGERKGAAKNRPWLPERGQDGAAALTRGARTLTGAALMEGL